MRFLLLLAILTSKFKKASDKDEHFKKFLLGHECKIVIKTNDGKKGKRFIFENGKFSADGKLDQFDAAMVWNDARTAFFAMKQGEAGITEAIQNHKVTIEGKLHSFTWFGAAINFVMA
jgi:hypothetical protein